MRFRTLARIKHAAPAPALPLKTSPLAAKATIGLLRGECADSDQQDTGSSHFRSHAGWPMMDE